MPASPIDSPMYKDLFFDAEVGKLFTDSAEVRAMMVVEGALAKAQAEFNIIPADSADAIARAAVEVQLDPASLAVETGQSAVPVPALVKAFRTAMQAPEHAQYLHWGATSQDIMDTGLVLRLRQVISIYQGRLGALAVALADLAEAHAKLPMAGRTYGQAATPTSFGAVAAAWGQPLLRHMDRLEQLKPRLLRASLSGAAGTLSVMGDAAANVRSAFARQLGLGDPDASWHSTRDTMAEFSAWMTLVNGTLGKMGEDLILMTQSGLAEVTLSHAGGSSTMPQKSNPVLPALLVALSRQASGLNGVMQNAVVHRQQRDGAAWLTEWMSLPQLCLITARALGAAEELATTITPDETSMIRNLDDGLGLVYAEALSFALAEIMPRPTAQAAVKDLCITAQADKRPLPELAASQWPDLDAATIFSPIVQLGAAPEQALAFASAARSRVSTKFDPT